MTADTTRRRAAVTLPSDTQIRITRSFDAPRQRLWKAWTTPELIKRWWHAKRGTATVADVDLRPGGRWRWAMVTHAGAEVAFHGAYREVVPPERLVYTEVFEGAPEGEDDPVVVTVTFNERDGRTTATMLMDAPNREVRDIIIQSGMEGGLQDALELLEEVARSLP
jgi:uncharacterized protein YndB with AHSA1/START domain